MRRLSPFLKTFLWSLAAWAATVVFYLIVFIVAVVFTDAGRARLSTVETVVLVLQVAQVMAGCIAVAFVFTISGRYFSSSTRVVWTVIYAAIQVVTTALLVLVLLVMFNR